MRLTDVVKQLLIINIIFFAVTYLGGDRMIDLLALHYPESDLFKPYQIVTHFFMHGGMAHIFFNMFALVMFGAVLEVTWGPRKFLYYYFICALGAALLHMGFTWWEIEQAREAMQGFQANANAEDFKNFLSATGRPLEDAFLDYANQLQREVTPALVAEGNTFMRDAITSKINVPIVGASGAIYGLLLAFGMLFPNQKLMLIFIPYPIAAKYFIPVLMGIELYLGFSRYQWDNIAHFAHLGGAITGFFLILYWRKFGSRL